MSALLTTRNAHIFAERTFERVHVVERIPWPKHGYTPQTWELALGQATHARYDIALIASEEPQAYSFAKRAKIAKRVGFFNGWEKPFKSLWARTQCTTAIYREASLPAHPQAEPLVLFALGNGLHPERAPTQDASRLRPLVVEEVGPLQERVLIQLTPKWIAGDRTPGEIASWLRELCDYRPCSVIAAQDEQQAVQEIAQSGGLDVHYFNDQRAWKAAIAQAPLLITPDTGAAHVAGMVGTPVVDIFEERDFVRYTSRWAPWAAPVRMISFPTGANKSQMPRRMMDAAQALVAAWAQ
ncbi:MAG: hypothetical protein M3N19_05580 [Candidatus Eremiobacteraeota bacterium]|nr:hypothetical protein [Candidatus Eremiobacteraeota bacterium]